MTQPTFGKRTSLHSAAPQSAGHGKGGAGGAPSSDPASASSNGLVVRYRGGRNLMVALLGVFLVLLSLYGLANATDPDYGNSHRRRGVIGLIAEKSSDPQTQIIRNYAGAGFLLIIGVFLTGLKGRQAFDRKPVLIIDERGIRTRKGMHSWSPNLQVEEAKMFRTRSLILRSENGLREGVDMKSLDKSPDEILQAIERFGYTQASLDPFAMR